MDDSATRFVALTDHPDHSQHPQKPPWRRILERLLQYCLQYLPFKYWTDTPLARLERGWFEAFVHQESLLGAKFGILNVSGLGISPASIASVTTHFVLSCVAIFVLIFIREDYFDPTFHVATEDSNVFKYEQGDLTSFLNFLGIGAVVIMFSFVTNVICAQVFVRPLSTGFPGVELLDHQANSIKVFTKGKQTATRLHTFLTLGYIKDVDDMWNVFLCQFDRNTFMISYNWIDKDLPRSLCSLFPNEICWLDINNLLPGTAVTETCANAAKRAIFRFVFLSNNYLKSKNCITEFEVIRKEPSKCFIFAYDPAYKQDSTSRIELVDQTVIENLRVEGFFVYELSRLQQTRGFTSKFRGTEMSRKFLLEQFVHTRSLLELFKHQSPPINACWLHTAIRLADPKPNRSIGLRTCLPCPLLFKTLFVIIVYSLYSVLMLFQSAKLVYLFVPVIQCGGILELLLSIYMICCVSIAIDCKKLDRLSDPALLLVVLRKLELIAPIKVYVNDKSVMRRKLELLQKYDVVEIETLNAKAGVDELLHEDPTLDDDNGNSSSADATTTATTTKNQDQQASVSVRLSVQNRRLPLKRSNFFIINVDQLETCPQDVPNNMICWTANGFAALPDEAKRVLSDTIVGNGPPDEEQVCLGMISSVLQCSRFALNVGGYPFQYTQNMLAQDKLKHLEEFTQELFHDLSATNEKAAISKVSSLGQSLGVSTQESNKILKTILEHKRVVVNKRATETDPILIRIVFKLRSLVLWLVRYLKFACMLITASSSIVLILTSLYLIFGFLTGYVVIYPRGNGNQAPVFCRGSGGSCFEVDFVCPNATEVPLVTLAGNLHCLVGELV
eukprot:c10193_g1_i1.p1 GENE.c10193_g1_i1~~c10193_g1_i1.p1  ORF type:complete len:855 (+),score=147.85 c10193_g1_i1:39-2567(+)